MAQGKPRTSRNATEARTAVIDALTSGQALPKADARELADRLGHYARSVGYSEGYDEGLADGQED